MGHYDECYREDDLRRRGLVGKNQYVDSNGNVKTHTKIELEEQERWTQELRSRKRTLKEARARLYDKTLSRTDSEILDDVYLVYKHEIRNIRKEKDDDN